MNVFQFTVTSIGSQTNVFIFVLFMNSWFQIAGQQTDSLVIKSEKLGTQDFFHIVNIWDKYGENAAMHLKEDKPTMIYKGYKPTILTIAIAREMIPVYVRRNQTITLQESGNKLTIKGLPACEMEILKKLNNHNRLIFNNSFGNDWNKETHFEQVGNYFENRYQEQLNRLQELSDSCSVGNDFIFCVRKKIIQVYMVDLFSPVTAGKFLMINYL